jgi:hypothetical protein
MAPAQPDPGRSDPPERHLEAVAIPAEDRRRPDDGERDADPRRPPPNDREGRPARPGDGDVAALDDGRLLSGDGLDGRAEAIGVVEVDVGDHGHAAVPGMGRVEPPADPDLDEGDVDLGLGEVAKDHRRQELEIRRRPGAACHPLGQGDDLGDEPDEGVGVDGSAVDDDPLAVRDEGVASGSRRPDSRPLGGRPSRGR